MFNRTRDTHENHDKNCEANGMETAILRSREELIFIQNYMNNTARIRYVGMGMKCVNGRFIWNDGREVSFGKWFSSNHCTDEKRVWFDTNDSTFNVESKNITNSMLCTESNDATMCQFMHIIPMIRKLSNTLSDTTTKTKSFHDETSLALQMVANNVSDHNISVIAQFDSIKNLVSTGIKSIRSNVSTLVSSHRDLAVLLESINDNLSNISVSKNELSTLLKSIGNEMTNIPKSQDQISTRILMLESMANYSVTLQNEILSAMKSMNDRIANISTNNSEEGKNSAIGNSSQHTNDMQNIEQKMLVSFREMLVRENVSENDRMKNMEQNIKRLLLSSFGAIMLVCVMILILLTLFIQLSDKIESIKAKDEKVIRFKAEDDGKANVYCN